MRIAVIRKTAPAASFIIEPHFKAKSLSGARSLDCAGKDPELSQSNPSFAVYVI
jgi:hypothetical protein